ncbi:putative diacylglycerol O-acyltransferase tgs1 [Gnomoniopsis sp. IMI 355080]|nr:putative diacylglycerol O-acyltransferase tgs1 [Gnomoniopsis sp. IMI 355080]
MAPAGPMPLTDECHQYEGWEEMPPEISKYWRQRHDLFSLYDSGIYLTDAAWFGVTAEPIAQQISAELVHNSSHNPRIIVDLFAGAGGNTIAFALQDHWDLVIGIEIDAATLACAQHNAALYGVADRILWVHGDCMDFLRRLKRFPWTLAPELQVCRQECARQDAISSLDSLARGVQLFASPPWGGPMYSGEDVLDLDAMEPYGVTALHKSMKPMAHAMFLPRNGDLNQLASLVPDGSDEKLDVVQYCINGSSKGMVAYYPPELDDS